jgi:hypothetical protein
MEVESVRQTSVFAQTRSTTPRNQMAPSLLSCLRPQSSPGHKHPPSTGAIPRMIKVFLADIESAPELNVRGDPIGDGT